MSLVVSSGPTSRVYFSQRLRLHYVDWGNAGRPPLVLLHGGRDHCRNWDWTAAALRADWQIIAPDLRGHGDSQWSADGSYTMAGYIYDLAQLIHQQRLAPVTIIAHSLGGNIALRYAGVYPETVAKLVAIEGLGPSSRALAEHGGKTIVERMDGWIREQRALAGRMPRRYASIEDAFHRMQEENPHLSAEQARHLTVHGVNQNEDGSYTWKFDNYVRAWPPYDMRGRDIQLLWSRISCPTLLMYGTESASATRPRTAGPSRSVALAWWASRAPGTGSITTGSTSSSGSSENSWPVPATDRSAGASPDGAERPPEGRPKPVRTHAAQRHLGCAQERGERCQRLRQTSQRLVAIEALTSPPPGLRRPAAREPGLEVHVANLEPLLASMGLGVHAADQVPVVEDRQRVVAVHPLRPWRVDLDPIGEAEEPGHAIAEPEQRVERSE